MTGALPPYPRDFAPWGWELWENEVGIGHIHWAATEDRAIFRQFRHGCAVGGAIRQRRRLRTPPAFFHDRRTAMSKANSRTHAGGPKALNLGGTGAEPRSSHPLAQQSECVLVRRSSQAGESADRQPLRGGPRGESPNARCLSLPAATRECPARRRVMRRLEVAKHHMRVYTAQLGVPECPWQCSDNTESQLIPELYGSIIA